MRWAIITALVALLWCLNAGPGATQGLGPFRAALAADPGNDRLRLGYTDGLLATGQWAEARRQAEALLHGSPDGAVVHGALQRLDALERAAPWQRRIWAEALPSDNVLMAPDARRVVTQLGILPMARRQSGYGLRAGGRLGLTLVPALGQRLVLAGRVERVAYPRQPALSRWSLSPSLTWRVERPRLRFDTGLTVTRTLYDTGRGDETRVAVSAQMRRILTPRWDYTLGLSHDWIDRDRQDHLDGTFTQLSASLSHRLTPDLTLTGQGAVQMRRAQLAHNGFRGARLGAGFSWEASPMDLLSGQVSVEHRVHDAPTPGFFGTLRREDAFEIELGWTNGRVQIAGAAPRLGCSYRRVAASIALYATQRSECGLRLERRF